MTGFLSIGVSGLQAAQMAILTTQHNVANANTPGYSRQQTAQATNLPVMTGAGALGQGVHVSTVQRSYDQFLTTQVNQTQATVSQLDTYYTQITQIDNMLADPDAGLTPAVQDFFAGVQDVASNPTLLPSRQSMISSAQTLVSRFQSIQTRLNEISDQVNGQIVDAVASVNSYASQIADLNQQIVVAQASFGQPANDLLDKRDQLVAELNKLIKVSTSTNTDGSFNVFIGSGQQLVVGTQAMTMTSTASDADPSRIVVGLQTGGAIQQMPESLIVGGKLGGLVSFRSQALDTATNELGRVAASLALTFNAQHALGQDLVNNVAGDPGFVPDFFTISGPKTIANALNTGAGSVTTTFSNPNAPAAPGYSGNFSTNLTTSDYRVQFGAGGAYSVLRLSDNQTVAAGVGPGIASFDGLDVNIGAVGNNGDSFLIQPLHDAALNIGVNPRITADPRLIAAAAPMRAAPDVSNQGAMGLSQGVAGQGYTLANLPLTLTANATQLTGFPGAVTAVYSDGSTAAVAGSVNLTNGTAVLAKISFDGMAFDVTGSPAAGDTFTIQRNSGGIQDNRNAVLLAKLRTQNTVAGGSATYQAAYAQMVSDNGIRTREAKVTSDAQQSLLNQATAQRESISGVNLDEEAANLIRFQQAYQASAKLFQVGSQLFDTLLSII